MKLLAKILTLVVLIWVLMPSPSFAAPEICNGDLATLSGAPWHGLHFGQKIPFSLFDRFFGEKYVMRRVLQGGPINIAEPFFAMKEDPNLLNKTIAVREENIRGQRQELVDRFGSEHASHYSFDATENRSVHPEIINQNGAYTLRELADGLANGALDFPIVFKRNASGLGFGVVFFEPIGKRHLKITASLVQPIESAEWRKKLVDWGFKVESEKDIATLTLSKKNSKNLIVDFLSFMMTMDMMQFDAGMFERKIDTIKYKGRSYETRHMVSGNLANGEVRLAKSEPNNPRVRWFARIGSSGYFSNFTERKSAAELEEPEMYRPLFEMFEISPERQLQFKKHVETLITREMQFMLERYKDGGINLPINISGAFDLMWLPPSEKGGFPIPVIIEADFGPSFPKQYFPNGPDKTIELTSPSFPSGISGSTN
jgi:hypothetical protein